MLSRDMKPICQLSSLDLHKSPVHILLTIFLLPFFFLNKKETKSPGKRHRSAGFAGQTHKDSVVLSDVYLYRSDRLKTPLRSMRNNSRRCFFACLFIEVSVLYQAKKRRWKSSLLDITYFRKCLNRDIKPQPIRHFAGQVVVQ